jgi:Uma2 family endonuclease
MGEPARKQAFTLQDFLVWDEAQPERHEFLRGEVFAQAGALRRHNVVALNLAAMLHAQLRGKPCRPFVADMKVAIERADCCFLPDVVVTCSEADRREERFVREPTLVIEVLSDSTAAFDRGDKFSAYQMLPTLRDYVLVDPQRRRIEVFRRSLGATWLYQPLEPGEALALASLGVELRWDEVFEGLESDDGAAQGAENSPAGP